MHSFPHPSVDANQHQRSGLLSDLQKIVGTPCRLCLFNAEKCFIFLHFQDDIDTLYKNLYKYDIWHDNCFALYAGTYTSSKGGKCCENRRAHSRTAGHQPGGMRGFTQGAPGQTPKSKAAALALMKMNIPAALAGSRYT
jgi:hypothetical protein